MIVYTPMKSKITHTHTHTHKIDTRLFLQATQSARLMYKNNLKKLQ